MNNSWNQEVGETLKTPKNTPKSRKKSKVRKTTRKL